MLWMVLGAALAGDTCREGLFVRDAEGILRVMRVGADRAVFRDDTRPGCPAGPDCLTKTYIVQGDSVIAAHTSGELTCVWYQGATRVFTGFVPTAALVDPRVGTFVYGGNDVTIERGPGGFTVSGTAIWQGLGDNVHFGELSGALVAQPDARYQVEGGGCVASFQWLGEVWAVSDNGACGGVNVSFEGIYRRK